MLHDNAPRPLDPAVLRQQRGVHWAARPLPPPVRTRKVSLWSRRPHDSLDDQLALWIEDLRVSSTLSGD